MQTLSIFFLGGGEGRVGAPESPIENREKKVMDFVEKFFGGKFSTKRSFESTLFRYHFVNFFERNLFSVLRGTRTTPCCHAAR